jgi:hypothetical protein
VLRAYNKLKFYPAVIVVAWGIFAFCDTVNHFDHSGPALHVAMALACSQGTMTAVVFWMVEDGVVLAWRDFAKSVNDSSSADSGMQISGVRNPLSIKFFVASEESVGDHDSATKKDELVRQSQVASFRQSIMTDSSAGSFV